MNLRPVTLREKHGPHTPAWAKHVDGLWEAVIVDQSGVDWEYPHQKNDVASCKNHAKHLHTHTRGERK